jgi:hypothetical protein
VKHHDDESSPAQFAVSSTEDNPNSSYLAFESKLEKTSYQKFKPDYLNREKLLVQIWKVVKKGETWRTAA